MNILQILPALDVGGVETGTVDLARYLVAHGDRAIVVSGGGRLVKELENAGARHYALPVGKKSPLTMLKMAGELKEIIRREEIDIVHARSRVPALIAYIACRMTGRVFITTAHGYYRTGLLSSVMSWGKYVIVASNIMAKHMEHAFGVPHDRVRLIPRGVDLSRFPFRERARRGGKGYTVGMVSRITPLKGHADFIKAIAIASREIPGLKAVIVGSAPKEKYREDLELLTRGLGLTRTVEFAGPQGDVPAVMHGLDLLVSATTTPEAFGRVIIEAQAAGVPVVATKVGGVVDIIEDGVNGMLCMPQSPADMAQKIIRMYREPETARAMAVEARKRVEEHYTAPVMMERTMAVYREALDRQNVLVIKISAVGDVILSVPSLASIRSRYPRGRIVVLVGVAAREVLDRCPYIDDVIVCDLKGKHRGMRGVWRLGTILRKECFDIVLDLQNNRKSHLLAFLSMAAARYGYDNGKWSFLLNRKQKDDAPHLDPLDHQFRTLRLAGIKPTGKALSLWPSAHDEERIGRFLADHWVKSDQPLVGIHVRASARWYSKNWPSASIAELCDRLARELNIRVVLTGAKDDTALAAHIVKLTRAKPINAVGKTDILEFACLVRRCAVFVTPDSASLHIAAAMQVPFVALFGPTDPSRHLVPAKEHVVFWKKGEFPCSPCYKPVCQRRSTCMRRISVDEVFGAVRRFLKVSHESPERIDAL